MHTILKVLPFVVLLSLTVYSVDKISCYVGNQENVESVYGFDYCQTTFYMREYKRGVYEGVLHEDKPIYEDPTPSNNGQCYLRDRFTDKVRFECVCYQDNCNTIITYNQFMVNLLALDELDSVDQEFNF